MTKQTSPITPPLELVTQWFLAARAMPVDQWVTDVATAAAQWGADRELEVCVQLLDINGCPNKWIDMLRAIARRPKPQSEADQALADLDALVDDLSNHGMGFKTTNVRRALERLKELEALPND